MSPFKLWIGGYGPEKSAHGAGLAAFREHVVSASNGDVEIDITWNIMDDGRPNTDLFELVESGEMFLCYFSSSYLGDRVNDLDILETPFLFADLDSAHHSLDGALGIRLRHTVRDQTGFEALGFWDNGFRHMTNRLRPIHVPEDCHGMTVRVQPNVIHEELIRCWGAEPVAVELSEGIRLITSETVDAQENPLANTVAYGVDEVHPYVTMTGHLYGARGLFANRDAYEALPDDLREIVDSGVRAAIAEQRSMAAEVEKVLRRDLETDGVEFVDLTNEEREEFQRAAGPAIEKARAAVPSDLFDLVEP